MCGFDSNLITDLATLLLVLCTGIYVRLIYIQNRDNLRPYVYANVEEVDHNVFFVIRNTGRTAARNVHITTSPSISGLNLKYADRFPIEPFLNQPVKLPQAELRTYVCNSMFAHMYYTTEKNTGDFKTNLTYDDEHQRHYNESYVISVRSIVYDHLYPNDKIAESLGKIAESLEKIRRSTDKEE